MDDRVADHPQRDVMRLTSTVWWQKLDTVRAQVVSVLLRRRSWVETLVKMVSSRGDPQQLGPLRANSASLFLARAFGATQGAIWFVVLIHGGSGLAFGPLAWIATLIGARLPAVAASMLLLPAAWLVVSWAPILAGDPGARDWLIVVSLTVPASIAAAIYLLRAVAHAYNT